MPLTTEQHVEITLLCGRDGATNRSVTEQFNRNHPHENVSHTSVGRLINKFRKTGSIVDKKRSGHPGLSAETRAQVLKKLQAIHGSQCKGQQVKLAFLIQRCRRSSKQKSFILTNFKFYKNYKNRG